MKEIKQRKERRFLKTLGRVGEILVEQVLLKLGSSIIKKIGGKKTLPSILFLLASLSLFAQYPNTGNKQRLGFQTTGDGLVYRGRAADTVGIKSSGLNNAYFILDTVNNIQYNYIKTKGGWVFSNGDTIIINNNFTQPVDSLFFNVNVPTNNVDTAKMRWDSDLATVVLGLNDNVPNELGFKNFWLVKNQTGSTITKGSLVYANGTVGASGRITVAKFIANGSIDAKYLLGITAHDLTDGEDGYVISFGKIRQVNTDTFAAGAILYPSPTVAGVWTDVEPVAPNINMPIGFCINSSVNNGTIAIRVASGYKLNELHDVSISSPVDKASLYYSGGLWRDTTPTLLVSDTISMLTNYLRSGVAASTYQAKLNGTGFVKASGTTISYDNSTYLTTATAASTYLPLIGGTVSGTINRQEGSHDGSTSTFYYNILNYYAKRDNNKSNQTAQITFTDRPGTATFENYVRTSDIYLMTAKNFSGGQLGQYLDTTLSVVANQDGGRVGISKLNPSYKLDVNGTLGVSGPSTFLDLQGAGSRMVVAGSGGLLSTQAIPTGTVTGVTASSPMASSGGTTPNISMTAAGVNVSGYVTHDGTQIFTGNKSFLGQTTFNGIAFFKDYTYQATRLAGLSSTDRFATVTLGSGLSLSAGVLSATSGGVTSVTASTPLSSSGGTTPNITIADAGTGSSGVVNTTTQSFAGNKTFTGTLDVTSTGTFGGRVKTNWLERNYAYSTSSSFTVSVNTTWQDVNTSVLTTITLPNAATYPGKELHIRQTGTGNLQSSSSNIIPFNTPPTGSTSTGILTASLYEAITLVSDGTNWIIMQRSGN